MTVKIVPATKDVTEAFALSPLEIRKVIFIPAAGGLIRGNRKTSVLNAFTFLSRIPPSRAVCRYQLGNASPWHSNPKHTTKPPAPSRCPASVASCEWPLLADQRLQESLSFCSELQLRLSSVGRNARERIRSSVLHYSLGLWLKTNGKHKMSDTTDSGKNAFNSSAPEICPNTCCKYTCALVQFPK